VPAIAKKTALPSGDWREVKQLLDGDAGEDSRQASLRLRPGAIVPLGTVVQNTGEPMLDTLTLLVNPGADGKASGELYEDSGDGFGYKSGDFRLTKFTAETRDGVTSVKLSVAEGSRATAVKKVVVRLLGASGEKTATSSPRETIVVR
jgi:alpha-glucosidase